MLVSSWWAKYPASNREVRLAVALQLTKLKQVAGIGTTPLAVFCFLAGVGCYAAVVKVLGVDSLAILFNHRSFRKPDPFSPGFRRFSRKIRIPNKN